MNDTTETAATKALLETGERLFNRLRQGEDVTGELREWSRRVNRMSSLPSRTLARVISAWTHLKAAVRAGRKP